MKLLGQIGGEVSSFAVPNSTPDFFNAPGLALKVAVTNKYAYVAQGADGPMGRFWGRLSIIDVTDPTNLSVTGIYTPNWIATDIVVISNTSYLTDGQCEFGSAACWGDLHILNVALPISPTLLGTLPLNGMQAEFPGNRSWFASSVAVAGHYAYITGGSYHPEPGDECGVRVVDVSDTTAPATVGVMGCQEENMIWPGLSIVVQDNLAYIAAGDAGLWIISVSKPHAPAEVGYIKNLGRARDVAIVGHFAYIAAEDAGLKIVDISKPTAPREVGSFKTSSPALGVGAANSYVYIAASQAGLRVIDVSEPTNPREVGFYDTSGIVNDAAVANGYIYVADLKEGLLILRLTSP